LNNTLYFTLKCGVLYNSNKCCTEVQSPSVGTHGGDFCFPWHTKSRKKSATRWGDRGACLCDIETCLNVGLAAVKALNDPELSLDEYSGLLELLTSQSQRIPDDSRLIAWGTAHSTPAPARINHKLRSEMPREAGWDKAGAESGEGCLRPYCPNRDSSPTPPASRKSQQMACD